MEESSEGFVDYLGIWWSMSEGRSMNCCAVYGYNGLFERREMCHLGSRFLGDGRKRILMAQIQRAERTTVKKEAVE